MKGIAKLISEYPDCHTAHPLRAGLVARAMQAWQDIGWFGTRYPVYDAPWWNVPVWDTSGCCASDISRNKFFGLMNALFGYSARNPPAPAERCPMWGSPAC